TNDHDSISTNKTTDRDTTSGDLSWLLHDDLGGGLALVLSAMIRAAISHAPQSQSGIASGMLNVSRQVGGVIGIAILGTLVGEHQTFLSGMHTAFVVCAGVLILGLVSAWVFVLEQRRPKVATAPKPSRTARRAEIAPEGREKPG